MSNELHPTWLELEGFAKNLEELNRQPYAVLERLVDTGVKLNAEKCEFLQEETTFLGEG